jgi:hypothetical protein
MSYLQRTSHSLFSPEVKIAAALRLGNGRLRERDEKFPASSRPESEIRESLSWLVRTTENVKIAPRCRQIVQGRLEDGKEQNLPTLVCVEPAEIPIQGIFSARGLARVQPRATQPSDVTSQDGYRRARARNSCAYVIVANFSDEELTFPKATVLGVAEEMSESLVDSVNAGNESGESQRVKQGNLNRNKALHEKLLKGKLDHLSEEERASIEPVPLRYAHLFHDEDSNDFKGTDVIERRILTGDVPYKKATV